MQGRRRSQIPQLDGAVMAGGRQLVGVRLTPGDAGNPSLVRRLEAVVGSRVIEKFPFYCTPTVTARIMKRTYS